MPGDLVALLRVKVARCRLRNSDPAWCLPTEVSGSTGGLCAPPPSFTAIADFHSVLTTSRCINGSLFAFWPPSEPPNILTAHSFAQVRCHLSPAHRLARLHRLSRMNRPRAFHRTHLLLAPERIISAPHITRPNPESESRDGPLFVERRTRFTARHALGRPTNATRLQH